MIRRYVHGAGLDEALVWYEGAAVSSATRRYLVGDERGSIVLVTDDTGLVVQQNTYGSFGEPGLSNLGRFQYTGQAWLTEAGVYHYKARAYHPDLGRFLQPDPIGYAAGLNMYAYVGNDPINLVDPWGLDDCTPGEDCESRQDTVAVTGQRRSSVWNDVLIHQILEPVLRLETIVTTLIRDGLDESESAVCEGRADAVDSLRANPYAITKETFEDLKKNADWRNGRNVGLGSDLFVNTDGATSGSFLLSVYTPNRPLGAGRLLPFLGPKVSKAGSDSVGLAISFSETTALGSGRTIERSNFAIITKVRQRSYFFLSAGAATNHRLSIGGPAAPTSVDVYEVRLSACNE